jgi:hypothetical protein
MRNFRTLNIWQEGITIVTNVYKLAELLPAEEKYGLRSQICRAAVSVPSNIAEGCSRNSQMDFKRFLEIALVPDKLTSVLFWQKIENPHWGRAGRNSQFSIVNI